MNPRKTRGERITLWYAIWDTIEKHQLVPPDRLTDADLYGLARLLGVEFEREGME